MLYIRSGNDAIDSMGVDAGNMLRKFGPVASRSGWKTLSQLNLLEVSSGYGSNDVVAYVVVVIAADERKRLQQRKELVRCTFHGEIMGRIVVFVFLDS